MTPTNPYEFSRHVSDPARFFGRKKLLRDLERDLKDTVPRNVSLIGERKIGKTSLLIRLLETRPDDDLWVYMNCENPAVNASPGAFYTWALQQLSFSEDPDRIPRAGTETSATRFNAELERIFAAGRRIVLLLDNFDKVFYRAEFKDPVLDNLRYLATRPLSLVLAARQMAMARDIPISPLSNVTQLSYLDLFDREEALEMIHGPSTRAGVSFAPDEAEFILELAGPFPYFLNAALHFAFDRKTERRGPLDGGDRRWVEQQLRRQTHDMLDFYWGISSEKERAYLEKSALAWPTAPASPNSELLERGLTLLDGRPFSLLFAKHLARKHDVELMTERLQFRSSLADCVRPGDSWEIEVGVTNEYGEPSGGEPRPVALCVQCGSDRRGLSSVRTQNAVAVFPAVKLDSYGPDCVLIASSRGLPEVVSHAIRVEPAREESPPGFPGVFISYATEDLLVAEVLCRALEDVGRRCWIATRDIRPSQDWADAIVEALEHAKLCVCVLSSHYLRSEMCQTELTLAREGNARIVPFFIENVQLSGGIRLQLGRRQWGLAHNPPTAHDLQQLVETVLHYLSKQE